MFFLCADKGFSNVSWRWCIRGMRQVPTSLHKIRFLFFTLFTNLPERPERCGPYWLCETEVNGDLKSTNKRGFLLVGPLGLSCRYKRFLFCLGRFSRQVILHRTLFQFFCPHRLASSKQSSWVACLLVCVSASRGWTVYDLQHLYRRNSEHPRRHSGLRQLSN